MDISIENINKIYFSHGRTAFKFGLEILNIDKNDEILVPSFICDVALHPLIQKKIIIKFYELDDHFQPCWDSLKKLISKKTKALLMVNYFGRAIFIEDYCKFCENNNIKLIEDNCHGFNGYYKKKLLGTFGDIGFTSPRKFLDIVGGGILYTKSKNNINLQTLSKFKDDNLYHNFKNKIKNLIKKNKSLNNFYRKLRNLNRPPYENMNYFKEDMIQDYILGDTSKEKISNEILNNKLNIRIKNYNYWHNFCMNNSELIPIFDNNQHNINPWCFPAYLKNPNESSKWYDFGWNNNVTIFSWPTLPNDMPNKLINNSKQKWKKLICFSTDNILK